MGSGTVAVEYVVARLQPAFKPATLQHFGVSERGLKPRDYILE